MFTPLSSYRDSSPATHNGLLTQDHCTPNYCAVFQGTAGLHTETHINHFKDTCSASHPSTCELSLTTYQNTLTSAPLQDSFTNRIQLIVQANFTPSASLGNRNRAFVLHHCVACSEFAEVIHVASKSIHILCSWACVKGRLLNSS